MHCRAEWAFWLPQADAAFGVPAGGRLTPLHAATGRVPSHPPSVVCKHRPDVSGCTEPSV